MFNKDKRSFFERITGSISVNDEEEIQVNNLNEQTYSPKIKGGKTWLEEEPISPLVEEEEIGELSVDVYQTDNDIVIQAMIAGVKSEDLNISITREMVTIEGHRQKTAEIERDGYFMKELYWGSFARKILLPCEVEPSEAEAYEKNGLLTLRMPKIDKEKTQKIKVRSL
ncbi:MAG TPA: Hsp20/alpha crystallin family protein [Candidatus Paceibacterota bacterium]|nr:Hsp20/alpha crystallin family protein [Candidatus Paceibacterota bacterium]